MPASSTYTPIATNTVSGSSTNSVSFNSIPQIYTDIIVVSHSYNTSNAFLQYMTIGTSNGNYSGTVLRGDGATVFSSRYTNDNTMLGDSPVGQNYQNSAYGSYVYHIMNYSNTSTFKTVISRFAGDRNGSGNTMLSVHTKRLTSAVTDIVFAVGGGFFAAGTTFTLYGIAAA